MARGRHLRLVPSLTCHGLKDKKSLGVVLGVWILVCVFYQRSLGKAFQDWQLHSYFVYI